MEIVQIRCTGCHATTPTLIDGPAPKAVVLESPADLEKHAPAIFIQVVQSKIMPLGNITQMTDEERSLIARWFESRSAAP
jgi:uncharacterized membrane protein